jgi:mannose-6-phosphate isomerase-like protein (cupin superfamily)
MSEPQPLPASAARVERRESCPRYEFAGGVWIILADSAQTGGHIANLEAIYSRGGGLPSLVRQHEAEFAYVIAGRVRVSVGEQLDTMASPGALIYVPRGVRRRLTAEVDDTRIYYGLVPAGSEALIVQLGLPTKRLSMAFEGWSVDASSAAIFGIALTADN